MNCLRSLRFSTIKQFDSGKDYYQILGVTDKATITDVKGRFYDLAKILHPDINPKL